MSEQTEHEALFEFIQRMEGRYPMFRYIHHSPNESNGGGRKVRTAYAKASGGVGYRMTPLEVFTNARMGVRAGFPDWLWPRFNQAEVQQVLRWGFAGLAFEMKAARSRAEAERKLSPEQRDWMSHFAAQGWCTELFWDWTDAARFLVTWEGGNPEECGL